MCLFLFFITSPFIQTVFSKINQNVPTRQIHLSRLIAERAPSLFEQTPKIVAAHGKSQVRPGVGDLRLGYYLMTTLDPPPFFVELQIGNGILRLTLQHFLDHK